MYGNTASPNPFCPQDIEVVRGKNRLNNTLTNKTQQGIEFIVNEDKTIKTNGTATNTSSIVIGQVQLTANETYTLSGCASNGGSGKYTLSISPNGAATRLVDDTGSGATYTPTTSGIYDIRLNYWYGFNIQNLTFKPMIEKGSQVTSYLPYNTLEVVVQNKNLFNKDNYNYINAWFLNKSSNISAKSGNDTIIYIKCRPNTTYTISKILEPNTSKNTLVVGTTTDIPNYGVALNVKAGEQGTTITDVTITTGSNDKYLCVFCHSLNANNTYNVAEMLATLQIELGSTTSSYIEHQEQTKTLHLGDIELAKIGTYQDRIFETSGKQLFDKSNSSQILNAFLNGSGKTIQSNSNARTLYIPIKPSTTYTISKTLSARFIVGTFESYEIGSTTTNMITATTSESAEITSRSNDNYLCVFYYLSTADTLSEETIRNSIMLNEGSTALPYEPYGSDKWYIEKNIGKKTFDGTESGWNASGNVFYWLFDDRASNTDTTQNIFCNLLYWNGNYANITGAQNMANYQIATNNNGTSKNIFIRNDNYTGNTTTFKTWLSTAKPIVLYQKATPTYTEITNTNLLNELNELEKMMSYSGQTNISVNGNLPMIINVTALKNLS